MSRDKFHMVKISTEGKLSTYLFSRKEEHGTLFPSTIKNAEEALSEIWKLLSKIERSNPTYTRINVWSEYSSGYNGHGPIRDYKPIINGVEHYPRSVWAVRSYCGDPVEYRISDGTGHGIKCTRKEFTNEIRVLVYDTIEVELYDRGATDALWDKSQQ